MNTVGIVMIVAGVALSCAVFVHDLRRLRIGAVAPQGAPKRMAPEIHALAALLTAIGSALIWHREAAVLALVLHGVLAWSAAPHVLDFIADRVLPPIDKP